MTKYLFFVFCIFSLNLSSDAFELFGSSNVEYLISEAQVYESVVTPQSYPPIYITINAHGHNYGIQEDTSELESQKEVFYSRHKEEIVWLADTTESYGAKMSYQLNGEYARDARVADDLNHLIKIHQKGHHLGGVHYHRRDLVEGTEFWDSFSSSEDEEKKESTYNNHVGEVGKALAHFGAKVIRVDSAIGGGADGHQDYHSQNISILPAGDELSYSKWNIKPWNPFRRQWETATTEDFDVDAVSVSSIGQVGKDAPAGLHSIYSSVPQLKRHFLMLLAEWREHERKGESPRVWSFGIMTHPDQNQNHREHMVEMIEFFKTFADLRTTNGNQIVRFVTDKELNEIYREWENNYPGHSSFNFDWESHRKWEAGEEDAVAEQYPYQLQGITEGLFGAELVREIYDYEGVVIYEFDHVDMELGPMNENYQRGIAVCEPDEEPVYMAWSDTGSSATIDFRKHLEGRLNVKGGLKGKLWSSRSKNLKVTPYPILISSTKRFWEEKSNCWCEQNPSDESCL